MTMRHLLVSIFLLAVLLSACSKTEFNNSPVMQETVTLQNLNEIAQKVKAEPSFTKDEVELFANGMIRLATEKDSLIGKTVLDIIKMQKDFVRSQAMVFFERAASRVDLAINHKFHYVGLQPRDDDKQMVDIIVFEITNTSDKDIRNIQGVLQFFTQDNQLVKVYNLKFDKQLKPGEMQRLGNPFVHDKASNRDQIIRSSTNLKALWNPTLIEYTDGSKKQLINGEAK